MLLFVENIFYYNYLRKTIDDGPSYEIRMYEAYVYTLYIKLYILKGKSYQRENYDLFGKKWWKANLKINVFFRVSSDLGYLGKILILIHSCEQSEEKGTKCIFFVNIFLQFNQEPWDYDSVGRSVSVQILYELLISKSQK